jgi:tetratricopeptide (TPR) repeat protein
MLRDPMSLFLLAILVFAAAIFAQPQPDKSAQTDVKMAIPGVKGALEINLGVPYWMEDLSEEGKEVQLRAMGRPDHLLITAFLQREKFSASPEKCRSEWWSLTKKNPLIGPRENLDESAIKDGIARVEFILPVFRGEKVNQKNIHAYVGRRDLCAEVHLSKTDFKPEDQQLFEAVLATVRFLPDEPAPNEQDTQMQIFKADRLYMRRDYKGAAALLQKLLDTETQHRTLNRDMFRVLAISLAGANLMRGELDGAKAAAEKGIAEDPEYPMFYYVMARIYADRGSMDACLEQLRLAYLYKENMIPGDDELPNPLEEDSFRRFFNDPKFVRVVREMQRH